MTDLLELPVDWFDAPEPPEMFTNNDLDPTEPHPADYQGPSMWVEDIPHPDMEGTVCSSGIRHEYRRWKRKPVEAIGLAGLPVPKHWSDCYD